MADIIKINDNTWRFEDDGVRFFLLCGTEKAALIDSGMNTPDARNLAERLTDLPLILINTHADPDHISGNVAFDEFYMSPAEEENYRANNGKGIILPVSEGDVIDLGGRRLEIIDIPGHTPGSIAILDTDNRILISGDTVQDGKIFMFGKYRNLDDFVESLVHLSDYEGQYDEIYPMHGTFPVQKELINNLIDGAREIKNKDAKGVAVNIFGNEVYLYNFPYAGCLCGE